jgi:hypothetical protein
MGLAQSGEQARRGGQNLVYKFTAITLRYVQIGTVKLVLPPLFLS